MAAREVKSGFMTPASLELREVVPLLLLVLVCFMGNYTLILENRGSVLLNQNTNNGKSWRPMLIFSLESVLLEIFSFSS